MFTLHLNSIEANTHDLFILHKKLAWFSYDVLFNEFFLKVYFTKLPKS